MSAWAFWVLTNQGFSGKIGSWALGKQDNKIGKTLANKRDGFTQEYAVRLKHVQIESEDALKVIKHYDGKDTFFYLDPPYFNSNCGHYKGYTEAHYRELLDTIISMKGMFLLSGYPSDILSEYVKKHGWHYKEIRQQVMVTHLTKKEKIEVLVWNYDINTTVLNKGSNCRPKKGRSAIKPNPEETGYGKSVRISDEKSKQVGPVYLPDVSANNGGNILHLAKEVQNFEDRKGSLSENKQISLERCRKALEQSGKQYTDEEILKIRKLLYRLGNLEYHVFSKLKPKLYDKLNPLRKSIHRRTSRQRHKHPLPKGTA